MNGIAHSSPGLRVLGATLSPWVELCKPGVTRLVLVTTWLGGLASGRSLSVPAWALVLSGTALVVAAANALNMVAEADVDALMERTRRRPLPSGRLEPAPVVRASFAAAAVGAGLLSLVDVVAALLAVVALVSYVWLYTPLKRRSPHALYVGAVPGAIPPLIGYAAATGGQLGVEALALFSLLAVWQVPHFLAISSFREDEYRAAGFLVFSTCRSPRAVRRLMLAWSLVLFVASLVPAALGMGGTLYLALAVGFGVPFVAGAAYGLKPAADRAWARSLFFASMPHLVVLFAGLVL